MIYRLVKRAERGLVKAADGFVVLTERAREIMFTGPHAVRTPEPPVEVIPCCVDLERFRTAETFSAAEVRAELGIAPDRRVLVYVGALGGWDLTEETAELLGLRPETVKTRLHRARLLLRETVEKQLGPAITDTFPFGGRRCERMTEVVVARLCRP